jgi:hypothetical protein
VSPTDIGVFTETRNSIGMESTQRELRNTEWLSMSGTIENKQADRDEKDRRT